MPIKKKSKYNNKIIYRADGKFDSKGEYSVWINLKRKEKLGEICDLKRQVPFVLIPAQYEEIETTAKNGKTTIKKKLVERECIYISDFIWTDTKTGEQIVADSKSKATITPEYIIKRKLMLALYGIKIKEILK